ncbi:RNA-binding protein [Roseibium aquae]|uniref:RNA-binding protein n=1 Tax=Roseibium aquae TaxID=1323746 RepID=UPI0035311583
MTIALERKVLVLEVQQLGTRRGPFTEACQLYEDLSSPEPPKSDPTQSDVAKRARGSGRPTKRERRKIDSLREPD